MQSTTRTWEHKSKFDVIIAENAGDYLITAGTNDKIYGFVDAGTRPHIIRAKRSPYLAFSSGYKAKTRVGVIGSNAGGAFGSPVFANPVFHPGFPGRMFIQKIQSRRQTTIQQEVSQAIAKVNRTMK